VSDAVERPVHPADEIGTCQSCARDDDDLVAVRRVYLVPESWDTQASATTLDEVELWCFACRSMYPHELAEQA
jgi:hypothetical protein